MNTCYNAIACTWITVTRVYTVNGCINKSTQLIRYTISEFSTTQSRYTKHIAHTPADTHSHTHLVRNVCDSFLDRQFSFVHTSKLSYTHITHGV